MSRLWLPPLPKYHGMEQRPWNIWAAEIRNLDTREKRWLNAFATMEVEACAYYVMAARYFGNRAKVNFPIGTHAPDFIEPPVRFVPRVDEKEHRKAMNQLEAEHLDAASIAKFIAKNL